MIKIVKTLKIGQYELSYTPPVIPLPVWAAALTGLASLFVGWLTGYNFDHRDAATAWWGGITICLMMFAAGVTADFT